MSAVNDLNDYLAAQATVRAARTKTRLHNIALSIIAELGPVQYDVPVPCLLCRNNYPITVSIADMAGWMSAPRGICKSCDSDSVSVTLMVVDG